jgi:hypothetical protein
MKKTIYTLFAIIGFANFTMAQLPSYVPTDSLKGWWSFNGNANDASGKGNNGTVLGGTTLTSDRFNNLNSAYTVDGINCPNAKGISLPALIDNSNSYSISIWFKTVDSTKSDQNILNSYPHQYIDLNFNYPFFGFTNKTCSWIGNGTWQVSGNSIYWNTFSLNNWHNIIVIKNTSSISYFQDGVLVFTQVITSSFNVGNFTSIVIGALSINGGSQCYETFKGKLDDVGIWNRALTVAEVANLFLSYNCPDTITTQPTNQVGNKGSNKTISFAHSGTGNSYQWQSNAATLGWQNVPNVSLYTGTTTNSLTVNNLSVSNHNQLFRVVTSKTGCKDTSNAVSLTLANIATDSLRLLRLQADSSRLTNDSIVYLARINKLMNDSAYYTSRILKLSDDSVFYVSRIAKLTNDSVYYNGRITKLISDSNLFISRINKLTNDSVYYNGRITKLISDSNIFVARINKLSNDSIYYLSRINKLSNDSVYYTGRIIKLMNDSNVFVTRINKLSYDSLINLGRITNLKIDSINNKTTISLLNADIVTKGNIIIFLKLDSTNKGITIRQLQTDLANKHDTVYIASVITSDTLRIAIRTGISSASPLINSLKVYPNPASTLLHIDLEKPGYFIAKLSSITGQSIITPNSGTIDVSSLNNGVYILTIYDSNNKLISTNKVAIIK